MHVAVTVTRGRTRQSQEDVVERRAPDAEIVERNVRVFQPAAGGDEKRCSAGRRNANSLLVVVDVGAALSARSYATDGSIVFDVVDEFCPWNEGRWKLEGGRAEPSKDEPELSLPVQSLGSALLGGVSFARLRRAGRLAERKPGAIERADALFRWDRHPWCPEIF